MNKPEGNMNTIKSISLGLCVALFAVAFAVATPVAHAQFDNGSDLSAGFGDGGGCCSYDTTPSYNDYSYPLDTTSYNDYSYPLDTTSYNDYSYPSTYASTPSYSTPSYSSPSYYTSTPSYSTPSYYATTPSYTAPSYYTQPKSFYTPTQPIAPSNTLVTDNGNTNNSYNPCANPNSCSTYDNGNTINSNNPTTDTCIYSGSCSTDNHSVVNANTTISSPTTVTISNPAPVNSQIVYNTPSSYAPAPTPTYYQPAPIYTPAPVYTAPVCTTCGCNSAYCPHPVAYNNPATPYVTLSQVPYTGLDLGPIGTVVYWSFLVLFSLVGAYLIVVKRAYRSLATSIGIFLFGSTDEDEAEAAATPVVDTPTPTTSTHVTARVAAIDYTDDFILSQIKRA